MAPLPRRASQRRGDPERARTGGRPRLPARALYVSTLAVNGDTGGRVVDESYRHDGPFRSVYDETKWRAHYEVAAPMAAAGLPLVTVLPGVVYGPGDRGPVAERLWRPYLTRDLPVVPRRTGFAFGHVDDTAGAVVRAYESGTPGEESVVAGHNRTLTDVLALAERLTGVPAARRPAGRPRRAGPPRRARRTRGPPARGLRVRVAAGAGRPDVLRRRREGRPRTRRRAPPARDGAGRVPRVGGGAAGRRPRTAHDRPLGLTPRVGRRAGYDSPTSTSPASTRASAASRVASSEE